MKFDIPTRIAIMPNPEPPDVTTSPDPNLSLPTPIRDERNPKSI